MLSSAYTEAFYIARILFNDKKRVTGTPYISHLMAVSSLVIEYGGTEKEATAAMLHDALEGDGYVKNTSLIVELFGDSIYSIIKESSDHSYKGENWRQVKEDYLKNIPNISDSARLINCADKLHNTMCFLKDITNCRDKEEYFKLFKGGKDNTLWYYEELNNLYSKYGPSVMSKELNHYIGELRGLLR